MVLHAWEGYTVVYRKSGNLQIYDTNFGYYPGIRTVRKFLVTKLGISVSVVE